MIVQRDRERESDPADFTPILLWSEGKGREAGLLGGGG